MLLYWIKSKFTVNRIFLALLFGLCTWGLKEGWEFLISSSAQREATTDAHISKQTQGQDDGSRGTAANLNRSPASAAAAPASTGPSQGFPSGNAWIEDRIREPVKPNLLHEPLSSLKVSIPHLDFYAVKFSDGGSGIVAELRRGLVMDQKNCFRFFLNIRKHLEEKQFSPVNPEHKAQIQEADSRLELIYPAYYVNAETRQNLSRCQFKLQARIR